MDRSSRLHLSLAAILLASMYFYLLVAVIGWTSATMIPSWWLEAFNSRHLAMRAWSIGSHTLAVLTASLPVAIAVTLITRNHTMKLAFSVGILGPAFAVLPSLRPTIWPLIWSEHPILFVTDNLKIMLAIPLITRIIRSTSSRRPSPPTALIQPG